MGTDHLTAAREYLESIHEKLASRGYDTDEEMRTDVITAMTHALIDIGESLRSIAANSSRTEGN